MLRCACLMLAISFYVPAHSYSSFPVQNYVLWEPQKVVTNITFNKKTYYVDITTTVNSAKIYLRTNKNKRSKEDIHFADAKLQNNSLNNLKKLVCRRKKDYDNGKMIVGCGATIGSGICVVVPAAAAAAPTVCLISLRYTASTGLVDCVMGVSDKITKHLANAWAGFIIKSKIKQASLLDGLELALEYACTDIK